MYTFCKWLHSRFITIALLVAFYYMHLTCLFLSVLICCDPLIKHGPTYSWGEFYV